MGKIKILPENIANKIAAGEVVERPASVVKELLENSIDAGAANITVEVEKGGIKKIVVTDNGTGMDKEDLQKCFRRHGTSKIYSEDDLLAIKSLGFRGEALASIAAVSKVTLKSKTKDETAGTVVEVEGGIVKKVSAVGMPKGTSATVSDLYYNVPARKKFLKTPATEFRHILGVVTNNALSFENIGFTLKHNGKVIFALESSTSREGRIEELLGKEVFNRLIPIFFEHPHLKIDGFVSKPNLSSQTRYKQYTFVNKRKVGDKVIAAAVREAYGTLLPAKTYPVFLLYLNLPYEMVDVNVHPRKEAVKFVNSQFIFQSVKSAVSHALGATDLTHTLKVSKGPGIPAVTGSTAEGRGVYTLKVQKKGEVRVGDVKRELEFFKKLLPWETEELKTLSEEEILQVHNLYLIKQTEQGILIVDQHAAHERILYEKFLDNFKREKDENRSQPLLLPQTIDLSFSEAEVLKENIETLTKIGFQIELFGGNSFKISAVPSLVKDHDIVSLITEVIEDLQQEKPPKEVDKKSLRAISFLACRSAIKAGDSLPMEQRRDLLEKLEQTKTKYTCPHGRPVKLEISLSELAKLFSRK